MRIGTYNIEWMNSLFDDEGNLLEDDGWSARYNITRAEQVSALGMVFKALDADAIMVIEAPDSSSKRDGARALETFAARFGLRARAALIGFPNDTQQEIGLLYDPDRMEVTHDPQGPISGASGRTDAPRFDGLFRIDLDVDAREDLVSFSKPPLEVAVAGDGFGFRMIGAHLKSKAPHGAETREEVLRQSIKNRRKQLAQAIWVRQRIDQVLSEDVPLMLLGDLNDGPGLDEYEDLFGRSSVEIILGNDLYDPHAARALSARFSAAPTTARFWIRPEKRFLQALLDYIMVSPDLRAKSPVWRIWHPLDDPECWGNAELREALVKASDHFPVTVDIEF